MDSRVSNIENGDRSRKKRRRNDSVEEQLNKRNRWRSSTEQSAYSTKLIEALRRVRRNSSPTSTVSSRSRAVRETADKILAIAARGRSRWSRAILANRLKLQMKNHKKTAKPNKPSPSPSPSTSAIKTIAKTNNNLPPLQRRVHVLGRLVPGCQKLSFPSLLEETTDYISALEMQVRAMSALAELLTGAGTSNSDRAGLT